MTIESLYLWVKKELAKFESADLEARWILSEALHIDEILIWTEPHQIVSEEHLARIRSFVERRQNDEPLAQILGYKDFYKFRFFVNRSVLTPRPETEMLVESALAFLQGREQEPLRICDIGVGSGCIGQSLLKMLPNAHLTAIELSPAALEVAKKNALALGIQDRIQFVQESARVELFEENHFDYIVSNPPYIAPNDEQIEAAVKKYEPASALFADDRGLRYIDEWLGYAAKGLVSRGALSFEIGSQQGADARRLASEKRAFINIQVHKDIQGHDRMLTAERS